MKVYSAEMVFVQVCSLTGNVNFEAKVGQKFKLSAFTWIQPKHDTRSSDNGIAMPLAASSARTSFGIQGWSSRSGLILHTVSPLIPCARSPPWLGSVARTKY